PFHLSPGRAPRAHGHRLVRTVDPRHTPDRACAEAPIGHQTSGSADGRRFPGLRSEARADPAALATPSWRMRLKGLGMRRPEAAAARVLLTFTSSPLQRGQRARSPVLGRGYLVA